MGGRGAVPPDPELAVAFAAEAEAPGADGELVGVGLAELSREGRGEGCREGSADGTALVLAAACEGATGRPADRRFNACTPYTPATTSAIATATATIRRFRRRRDR
jgi:hypothetical protein